MRSRTVVVLATGVAALVLTAALAPATSANAAGPARPTSAAPARGEVCFKNLKPRFRTDDSIPSVNYDQQGSDMDSQAADDFTLTEPCLVREVDVLGTFTEQSELDWETVYLYPDGGSQPGFPALWVQSALNGRQGRQSGDLRIRFGPLMLQPGTYWISVQAQLKSGLWGWDVTTHQRGSGAVFQNPDQGFPGCPSWQPIQACFPGTTGPDLLFALRS